MRHLLLGRIVVLLLLIGWATPVFAATPQVMNFQGRLTDQDGQPLDGPFPVTLRLFDAAAEGTTLWEEMKTVAVSAGLFSTLLGDQTPLNLPFDRPYWVEIAVGSEILTPRQPLASSPYAMRARRLDGIEVVNGNVGIGTDIPGGKLHLVGAGEVLILQQGNSVDDSLDIMFYVRGAPSGSYDWDISYRGRSARDVLRVYEGGGASNWEWQKGGNAWMRGTLTQSSDVRLKTDIQPIPNALERICAIRGVNFRWKDNPSIAGLQMGVIGQEVENVFPGAVSTAPNGMKSVSYSHLTGALIEAVKELKRENEALRERLDRLEGK